MTIEEYFGDWSKVVDLKETDKIVRKLVSSKQQICPNINDLFKAFKLCPLKDLRLVIIGMDPYATLWKGKPTATGIAFANSPDTPESSYSPSLSVLKESVIDYSIPHGTIIFDPSLEKWEKQGVLLLNSALSCTLGRTGSHTLLWRPFMRSLLTNLSLYHTGIIYVLMGNEAQALKSCINGNQNHVVRIRHPSWYARQKTKMPSEVWHEVNDILIGLNGCGIEWYQEY